MDPYIVFPFPPSTIVYISVLYLRQHTYLDLISNTAVQHPFPSASMRFPQLPLPPPISTHTQNKVHLFLPTLEHPSSSPSRLLSPTTYSLPPPDHDQHTPLSFICRSPPLPSPSLPVTSPSSIRQSLAAATWSIKISTGWLVGWSAGLASGSVLSVNILRTGLGGGFSSSSVKVVRVAFC